MASRIHLVIHGEVHGVFFRDYVRKVANFLKLTGWARNNTDGTVEAVAEGDRNSLEEFLEKCSKGPALARVDKVDSEWGNATGDFIEFRIVMGQKY